MSVPGPGSWLIAVWLTDQAGNSTPANATRLTATVPSGGGSGGGRGPGGGGARGGTKAYVKLHVTEALHGCKLTVRVTGPMRGALTVRYAARLSGRTVAHAAKVTRLPQGSAVVTFTLGPITAAHATIEVAAQIDHETATPSTLEPPSCAAEPMTTATTSLCGVRQSRYGRTQRDSKLSKAGA